MHSHYQNRKTMRNNQNRGSQSRSVWLFVIIALIVGLAAICSYFGYEAFKSSPNKKANEKDNVSKNKDTLPKSTRRNGGKSGQCPSNKFRVTETITDSVKFNGIGKVDFEALAKGRGMTKKDLAKEYIEDLVAGSDESKHDKYQDAVTVTAQNVKYGRVTKVLTIKYKLKFEKVADEAIKEEARRRIKDGEKYIQEWLYYDLKDLKESKGEAFETKMERPSHRNLSYNRLSKKGKAGSSPQNTPDGGNKPRRGHDDNSGASPGNGDEGGHTQASGDGGQSPRGSAAQPREQTTETVDAASEVTTDSAKARTASGPARPQSPDADSGGDGRGDSASAAAGEGGNVGEADEKKDAPAADEKEDAPAADEKKDAPAADEKELKEGAPAADEKKDAPAGDEKKDAPAADEKKGEPAGDGPAKDAPAAFEKKGEPAADEKNDAPAAGEGAGDTRRR